MRGFDKLRPTVLLVDDEPVVREVASEMLEALGYNVITASNGVEAVEIYEGLPGSIALIILDIVMPIMDGEETARTLKAMSCDIPIIMTSGYSADADHSRLLELGCKAFLQKPYTLRELRITVETVIDSK